MPVTKNHNINMISKGQKFLRRTDLTPAIRLHIAYLALDAQKTGKWGKITELARDFMISRTFVYMLASLLATASVAIFSATPTTAPISNYLLPLCLHAVHENGRALQHRSDFIHDEAL